jgi:G3E family GTPase
VKDEVRKANPQAEEKSIGELADELEREVRQESHLEEGGETLASHDMLQAESAREEDDVHHLSHRFSGVQVPLPGKIRRASIERLLVGLPPWVLRAKALVKLAEQPGSRWLFERSGSDPVFPPIEVPGISRVAPSLVCIGAKLDPVEIEEHVRRQFGELEWSAEL